MRIANARDGDHHRPDSESKTQHDRVRHCSAGFVPKIVRTGSCLELLLGLDSAAFTFQLVVIPTAADGFPSHFLTYTRFASPLWFGSGLSIRPLAFRASCDRRVRSRQERISEAMSSTTTAKKNDDNDENSDYRQSHDAVKVETRSRPKAQPSHHDGQRRDDDHDRLDSDTNRRHRRAPPKSHVRASHIQDCNDNRPPRCWPVATNPPLSRRFRLACFNHPGIPYLSVPTFIDESGDAGTKRGASAGFRLAAVVFEFADDLENFSIQLSTLRNRCKLPASFQFHFSAIGHGLRMEFFEDVGTAPFSFVVSALDKPQGMSESLTKKTIFNLVISGLTKHLEPGYTRVEQRLSRSRGLREIVISIGAMTQHTRVRFETDLGP